ncbi:rab effector MyRIP [Gadus macrocephalus]|uniref:rab effector MyRIP n=1 Tax=Gadus macrocephalus TaxID=80720 RepID=UPI0028CB581C|nr:rab effector MyRIP [Gadus macrocephalus]
MALTGTCSPSPPFESSVQEGSNDNDDSVCGSDSAFYKQSEGHSMADTLTVALRVAEEAIEEAISKAEEFSDSLEKQNEARYLRDHKEDLIEELATTIVHKIIQRRKRSVMQSEYDFVWPQPAPPPAPALAPPPAPPSELASPALPPASSQGSQEPLPNPYSLWRSRSAFSLTSDDSPQKGPEDQTGVGGFPEYASLKREAKATALPSWKSVDRLDNSSASSVLQSPDGNWMALQSSQLSRPSLLTKRKSLVFSALEKESGVVSAYDEMGSESGGGDHNDNNDDDEDDDDVWDANGDEGGWGAALHQFRRKLSDETQFTASQPDPEWTFTRHPSQPPLAPPPLAPPPATSPPSGRRSDSETLNASDPEAPGCARPGTKQPSPKQHPRPLKKRGPPTHHHLGGHQNGGGYLHQEGGGYLHQEGGGYLHQEGGGYQLPPEALDVNFNPKVMGDSSGAEESASDSVRRSRRRRKSKRESPSEQSRPGGPGHTPTVHPLIRENSGILLSAMLKRSLSQDQPGPGAPPSPLSPPGPPGAPEEGFFNSEATERDPDTLAPHLTPGSLGAREGGPRRPQPGPQPGPQAARRSPNDTWGPSSSEDERVRRPPDRATDGDGAAPGEREEEERAKHGTAEKRRRQTASDPTPDSSRTPGPALGPGRREGPAAARSAKDVGGSGRGKRSGENGGTSIRCVVSDQRRHHHEDKRGKTAERRGERRQSLRQQKRGAEKKEAEGPGPSGARGSPAVTACALEGVLLGGKEGQHDWELQQRLHSLTQQQQQFSAASLCSITTEVLKVLNATEDLIGEAGRVDSFTTPSESMSASPISSCSDTSRLENRLTKMEQNVYLAASAVYGLEGALGDLEECARSISSGTTDTELAFLEDQVATAAAQVQQSELQISNIEARISALKTAGLNVTACNRFSKYKPKPQTLDSSRHQRRKLPAPPLKEKLDQEQQVLWP